LKKTALIPTSTFALRFAAIMHRRSTSKWNEAKEIKPFRKLLPVDETDIEMVERYYRWHWPPMIGKNNLRHDLATLINNWSSELDRAQIWCEAHPPKSAPRKIIPLPVQPEAQMSEAERAQASAEFRKLIGREPRLR